MSKKYIVLTLLYLSSPLFAEKIDIAGLSALDETNLINIPKIADFRDKAEKLLHHEIRTKTSKYNLAQLVQRTQDGLLPAEQEKILFEQYLKQFMHISHHYFNDIRHLKPILVKIISIWAEQRGRTDSTILLWASIEPGKEEQFAHDFPPKLKDFYTFLTDIDMLLQDLMHSCPKSYAHYLECKKIVEEKHQSHG